MAVPGRHIAANALTFTIVGLVMLLGLINWGQRLYHEPGPTIDTRVFEVPSGASLKSVSASLASAEIVSNATVFRIGVRYSGLEDSLKFGVYNFPAGASMEEIAKMISTGTAIGSRYRVTYRVGPDSVGLRYVDLLAPPGSAELSAEEQAQKATDAIVTGATVDFRVTVPEGLTSWEIVQGLNAIDTMAGEIAEIPPEGSLAPDTYSFQKFGSRLDLIDEMSRKQYAIVATAWENRVDGLPISTPEEMLVLASIVEKEAGGADEWRTVASVFVNRLRQGIRLQADATIVYGLTEGKGRRGFDIRQSEINRRTPYNTYQIDGLPPTPIGNPGRAAIEATVNPEVTDYLFFVADGTGGHAFAVTNAEHERNVATWKALQAQGNN